MEVKAHRDEAVIPLRAVAAFNKYMESIQHNLDQARCEPCKSPTEYALIAAIEALDLKVQRMLFAMLVLGASVLGVIVCMFVLVMTK